MDTVSVDQLPIPQDLKSVVREWQRLAWFTVDGSPTFFVHTIGVKPSDPSTDVLFAFVSACIAVVVGVSARKNCMRRRPAQVRFRLQSATRKSAQTNHACTWPASQ